MKKIFMLVVPLLVVMSFSNWCSKDAGGDSIGKLAQSLEQLVGSDFIELLGAAIGKEHLHVLDADRNIYRIDVPQAGRKDESQFPVYFLWNAYMLEDLLMSDLFEAQAKYKRLIGLEGYDTFKGALEKVLETYKKEVSGGKSIDEILKKEGLSTLAGRLALFQHQLTAARSFYPTTFEPLKKYDDLKGISVLQGTRTPLDANKSDAEKDLRQVFSLGIRGAHGNMFGTKDEHDVVFYVYRYRDTLYGFYVDSLDNASWDDGKTAAIAQKIMDEWRAEQKKLVS